MTDRRRTILLMAFATALLAQSHTEHIERDERDRLRMPDDLKDKAMRPTPIILPPAERFGRVPLKLVHQEAMRTAQVRGQRPIVRRVFQP